MLWCTYRAPHLSVRDNPKSTLPPGQGFALATTKAPVKKEQAHYPRQQAGKSGIDRGCLGCHPYQGYFLQRKITLIGSKAWQKAGFGGNRALNAEDSLSCAKPGKVYRELATSYVTYRQ